MKNIVIFGAYSAIAEATAREFAGAAGNSSWLGATKASSTRSPPI